MARINNQWRICFVWREQDAYEVEIVDDHSGGADMTIRREDLEAVDFADTVDPGADPIPHPRPGEILREIMQDQKLAARALAREIGVPVTRITEILHGERAITAETAIMLGRRFAMSAESWMGLQMAFDLAEARAKLAA